MSTIQSEYIAFVTAVQEVVWLRIFLQCDTLHAIDPTVIHCGIIAALAYMKDQNVMKSLST